MLSATLAVEGHTPNYVFSPTTPVAFRHHLPPPPPPLTQTPTQQQHNLQQHQLHVQYLHQQYLVQQQQQHQQERQHLHQQFHRAPQDLFNSYGLQPAPSFTPTLLDSWHRDLVSVASVTKPFLNNRRLPTPLTNSSTGTCTITSGSLQSNHKPHNVPQFLIPQVPIKPLVQNNRINGQKYVQQPTPSAPTNANASTNDTRHSCATNNNNANTITDTHSNSNSNSNTEMPVNLTIQPNSSKNLPTTNDGAGKLPSPSPSPTTPYSPYGRFFPNTSVATQFPLFPAIIFQPHQIQHAQVQQLQPQNQEPYIVASNPPTYIVPHPGLSVPNLETAMPQTEKKLPFKVPAGKEGSLKHRILTRLSPEPTIDNNCLPLEAEDLSIKGAKNTNNENGTGTGTGTGNSSSRSSSHSGGGGSRTNSPKTVKKECDQTFNSFLKGSLIQLANGVVKKIEEMTTDDFVQCAKFRPDLRLLDSTIVQIHEDSTKSPGCINITVNYNEHHSQMVIPTRTNHPFFVYKQGWASYDPELTEQAYGIKCRRLNVGDVIVSLQPQDHLDVLSRDITNTKTRPPTTPTTPTTVNKQTSPLQSPSYPKSPSVNQQPKPLSLTKKRKSTQTPSPSPNSPHQLLSPSSSSCNNYVNVPTSTSSVMLSNNVNANDNNNDDKKVAKIRKLSSQDAHNNNMALYSATSK